MVLIPRVTAEIISQVESLQTKLNVVILKGYIMKKKMKLSPMQIAFAASAPIRSQKIGEWYAAHPKEAAAATRPWPIRDDPFSFQIR